MTHTTIPPTVALFNFLSLIYYRGCPSGTTNGCYGLISGCSFVNNIASDSGGGVQITKTVGLYVTYDIFINNYCTNYGGAYYATVSSYVSFENIQVIGNRAGLGGAGGYLLTQVMYTTLRSSVYANNVAGVSGGAVYVGSGNSWINIVNVR
jgi:predicted outer membrane repeat protein